MPAIDLPTDTDKQAATTERTVGREELADTIIRDCWDDPRAAVIAMLKINSDLIMELHDLSVKRWLREM